MTTADVIVVGGGVMGSSIAYHLAREKCRVLLLERNQQLGAGATGHCSGGVRHQFSHPLNVQMSIASIYKLKRFEEEMEQSIDFYRDGYLFLLTRDEDVVRFTQDVSMQRSLGVPSQILTLKGIGELIPQVALDGVVSGAYCSEDGIADPSGVTLGYARKAREFGAKIRKECEVTGITKEHGRVTGVIVAGGDRIASPVVVNAAGPWSAAIGQMAEVPVPVVPYRRFVFVTHAFPGVPASRLMVVDFASSFYFHREGEGVLMGMGDPDEPSSFREDVDWTFLDRLTEVGMARYPALAAAAIRRAWAGLYEVTPDSNPILGEAPGLHGFYLATGFSGHGFMHGPIVGELIADSILHGHTSLDLAPFSLARFVAGGLRREANVI